MNHVLCIVQEVRKKRVARDYQLVSTYFKENPLIPFGVKISPLKMASLLKMKKSQVGAKEELVNLNQLTMTKCIRYFEAELG